jgi:hypothetical protein
LEAQPEIQRDADKISITAPSVKVSFTGAEIESQPQAVVVHLR